MLFEVKYREDLADLEELASLQDQVEEIWLQDKPGKQNYHQNTKTILEPITDAFKNTSQDTTNTFTETSFRNNKAIENLSEKFLEKKNDSGILASCLLSPPSKTSNPENTSQFDLVEDSNSKRVNDMLIHNTIPVTLYNVLLIFRGTGNEFELKGDLLKMTTNKNYNVDLASLSDKKLLYDFAKEMYYDVKDPGRKST